MEEEPKIWPAASPKKGSGYAPPTLADSVPGLEEAKSKPAKKTPAPPKQAYRRGAKPKKKRKMKRLFGKILVSISFPLILLLLTFAFLLGKLEYQSQQRYHDLQARSIMQAIHDDLESVVDIPGITENKTQLQDSLKKIAQRYNLEDIDLINPVSRVSLVRGRIQLDDMQLEQIQESVAKARQGKDYHSFIDRGAGIFYGYVPVWVKSLNQILVLTLKLPTITLKEALTGIAQIGLTISIFVLFTAFFIAIVLTWRIVHPIQEINRACRKMLSGALGHEVKVRTGDELEMLARNFNRMSKALLIMQNHAADSNPLTKLPGNQSIMAEMDRRLKENEAFVFIHADIDHFKAFNDHYGLEKGDEVLRDTGLLVRAAVDEIGAEGNFVGHQGGDDFVLILKPWQASQIADLVCKKFDTALKKYYRPEELEAGYFETEDTRNVSMSGETVTKRFPLMSISLAGIEAANGKYPSREAILDKAVIVKKKVKKVPYSNFVIEG